MNENWTFAIDFTNVPGNQVEKLLKSLGEVLEKFFFAPSTLLSIRVSINHHLSTRPITLSLDAAFKKSNAMLKKMVGHFLKGGGEYCPFRSFRRV